LSEKIVNLEVLDLGKHRALIEKNTRWVEVMSSR